MTTRTRFLIGVMLLALGAPGCGGDVRFAEDGDGAQEDWRTPRERLRDACETYCSPAEGCGWSGLGSEARCVAGCTREDLEDDCVEPLVGYVTCLVERGCRDDCIDVFPECVLDE